MSLGFDQKEGFIFLKDKFVPWKEANIHILTHGLHYGSSCFEGLRIYNGKIFKNKEHAERLLLSAEMMDFRHFAHPFTAEEIAEICNETCKKNNILNGYIRPILFRGSEQIQISAPNTKAYLAVAAWNFTNTPKSSIKLLVGMYKRQSAESAPVLAKAGGLYVSSTLAKHEAEREGFDDCLMLDYRNYIAECSTSNIFFCFEKEIHTPIADCFLNGITRQTVIEMATNLGYKVVEGRITMEELSKATEAFATGTASEIVPVSSVTLRDLKTTYNFPKNEVTTHLISKYKELVLL